MDKIKISKQKKKWEECSTSDLIEKARKIIKNNEPNPVPRNPNKPNPVPQRTEPTNRNHNESNRTNTKNEKESKLEELAIKTAKKFPTSVKRLESFADCYNFEVLYENNPADQRGVLRVTIKYPRSSVGKPIFISSFDAKNKETAAHNALKHIRPNLLPNA